MSSMLCRGSSVGRRNVLVVVAMAWYVRETDGFIVPILDCARFPTLSGRKAGEKESIDTFSNPISEQDTKEVLQPKKKRQVDFPSFSYNVGRKGAAKRGDRPPMMKFRNSLGQEQIFRPYSRDTRKSPKWLDSPDSDRDTKTRLRSDRSYARKEPFEYQNVDVPPSLEDLSARPFSPYESFWITTPARVISFSIAYICFPFIARAVVQAVTMPPDELAEITGKFAPGISILYGTFISLTLSILYNRQRTIQNNVGVECSCLVVITRNLVSLFRKERTRAIEAGQCVADQIRTLVKSSRGAELMLLMYSDPYARMRELVDSYEEELYEEGGYDGRSNSLIGNCRDTIKDLYRVRASRLSDEALALPPTHFFILNVLTLLILLGYVVSIAPTLDRMAEPSPESSFLFAILTTVYILFYNFASDLNEPFTGVYQIRRSCAASHLHQLKWLIANHPLLRGEVDFEEEEEEEGCGVQICSPGLGDIWFEKQELFVGSDLEDLGERTCSES